MPTNAQKARAGGHLVVAELLRRGVGDVRFDDSRRSLEIEASDTDGTRTVTVRVKTKTTGDWQTSIAFGKPCEPDDGETRFWVLVDIGGDPSRAASYFVVPNWWMANYIHEEFQSHLQRHGGTRPVSPGSTHCAIRPAAIDRGETAGTRSACADPRRRAWCLTCPAPESDGRRLSSLATSPRSPAYVPSRSA
jgi:hypothetical protein